jgi:histidinol dehydrogenase
MGVIPAKLAGVKNIIILSPPGPTGRVNDYVLAAAALTEANGLYAAGGAQAVAAACYGTQTLKPVSMIIGPGNNYVMRAKWQLSLQENLAIDSPAGPSEVLIIAEDVVPPEWVAADLLSQAEHGEDSPAILVTTDRNFGQRVKEALSKRLAENTPRNKIKSKAIDSSGSILVVNTLDEAIDFANRFAPEHLQIMTRKDSYVLSKITRAGSVFVGPYSPVAAGDYASGTNHILPTSGLAGIYSGLSVDTFYRTFTYQKLSKKGLARIAPTIRVLSQVEGLDEEHGRSVELRLR